MIVQTRSTNGLAIVSLVSGILCWLVLPFIGAIVAIITGHMARSEISNAPERFDSNSDGLALAGLILGWVNLILSVLGVLLFLFVLGGIAMLALFAG